MNRMSLVVASVLVGSAAGSAAAQSVCSPWEERTSRGRTGAAMVFDEARGKAVLFGGDTGLPQRDTRLWVGAGDGAWEQVPTEMRPAGAFLRARKNHAMAYDSARGVTVMVGGLVDEGDCLSPDVRPNRETWEFDGTAWTFRSQPGPHPREQHAMAYDEARGVTVLFGGRDVNGTWLGDTWTWDGSVWTRVSTIGPSGRFAHAMAYDSARERVVLFGGYDGAYSGETWEWDGSAWTLRSNTGPSGRSDHAMAYDEARGVTVLFGGWDNADDGETWEWDGTAWTRRLIAGPSAREGHAMAYDSVRDVVVLHAGHDEALDGETWEYDGSAWVQTGWGDVPMSPNPEVVYDSAREVTLLHGKGTPSATTWAWDGADWALLSEQGPVHREDTAMAFDESRGVTVLFGGRTGTIDEPTCFGDTWEWDGAAWALRSSDGPSPRYGHSMAYDSVRGVVMLFGGKPCGSFSWSHELWEWDGSAWTLVWNQPPQPVGTGQVGELAFDRERGVMMLYTNCVDATTYLGCLHEWTGEGWTLVTQSNLLPNGGDPALVFDEQRRTMAVIGGMHALVHGGPYPAPDFEWDGERWVQISAPWRAGMGVAYDRARGVYVGVGGTSPPSSSPCMGAAFQNVVEMERNLVFTDHPQDTTAAEGATVQFTVGVAGPGPLSYQWRRNGIELNDLGGFSGAHTPTLTITGVTEAEEGVYSCKVSAGDCAMDESRGATLDVNWSCVADFDGNGELSVADFAAFRAAYLAGDPAADLDGSGVLSVGDFTAFRNAYLAGCP